MNKILNPKITHFFKTNGSSILTGMGIVGVIMTSVDAIKSTPKAMKRLEEAEKEKGEELTKMETIVNATPAYVGTLIFCGATISCILGANILSKKQQAALISAYSLINNSYNEYKNKVKELYGQDTHDNIMNSIAQEKASASNIEGVGLFDVCRLEEDDDDTPRLFYDEFADRYFESSLSKVIAAEYHFNRNFLINGVVCLNELYDFLGIAPTENGDLLGWSSTEMACNTGIAPWIDFNHRKIELDSGLICYAIEIPYGPSVEAMQEW